MHLHVRTRGCRLSPLDEQALLRRVDRLERRLQHIDGELVHLEVTVARQARRVEYASQIRLVVMNRSFPAWKNRARGIRALLNRAFDDLEKDLDRLNAELRGATAWQRKRGLRGPVGYKSDALAVQDTRALLDRALTRNRTAFDVEADRLLPGLRRTIYDILSADGRHPTDEELDGATVGALSKALEELKNKPERWSFYGWLAWIARRELRERVRA